MLSIVSSSISGHRPTDFPVGEFPLTSAEHASAPARPNALQHLGAQEIVDGVLWMLYANSFFPFQRMRFMTIGDILCGHKEKGFTFRLWFDDERWK